MSLQNSPYKNPLNKSALNSSTYIQDQNEIDELVAEDKTQKKPYLN